MQISLINSILIGPDAVGKTIIQQAQLFRRLGHDVRIFVESAATEVPPEIEALVVASSLGDLIGGRQSFFTGSDLFIYHYPLRYALLESIRAAPGAVLFDYHGVTPPDLWGVEDQRALLERSVEGVRLVHYADLAMAHSGFTAGELVERYRFPADRVRVLPYAVPLDQFHPGEPDPALVERYGLAGRRVLLYVGRMAGNKRVDLLVRALPEIQIHCPGTRLLLVGDDRSTPYSAIADQVRILARELGVAKDVVFTGAVTDPAPFYQLADAFVTASLHEGFCVPVPEAMASGVPVVASRSAALPDTVGDAGLTFAPEDVGDLTRQVVAVLVDADLRGELVEKGIERARRYSLPEYEANLQALVMEAVAMAQRSAHQEAVTLHPARTLAFRSGELAELRQEAAVGQPGYTVRSDKPVVGPAIAWVRRNMTSHLREPYLDPIVERQVRFNAHLASYLYELEDDLVQLATEIAQRANQLRASIDRGETGLATLSNRVAKLSAQVADLQAALAADPDQLRQRFARLEQILAELPDAKWNKIDRLWQTLTGADQPAMDFSYRACADRVGGCMEVGRALYAPFAALFRDSPGDVLDVACGQGPFLSLLHEMGIPGRGVDLDGDMVTLCREAGLDVVEGDAMKYLASQPDASLGGIFCAHFVEHLPKALLIKFLDLCYAKLRPGARVVLITPNGGGLTIFHATFYKDLTHYQPLHPEALRFLLEAAGFQSIQVDFISAYGGEKLRPVTPDDAETPPALVETLNQNFRLLNELLFGNQDCAITGIR